MQAPLIGNWEYRSRLLIGTGKYKAFEERRRAMEASGAEIVTYRRMSTQYRPGFRRIQPTRRAPTHYTYLPNSAGSYTAKDALRELRLAGTTGAATTWPSSR